MTKSIEEQADRYVKKNNITDTDDGLEKTLSRLAYIAGAKSAAIISELIEIIKSQSEALDEYKNQSCSVMEIDYRAKQTLSETTTRLQKLRDGK